MSYPDPLYFDTGGEATAVVRPADAPADLLYAGGWPRAHYLARGTLTGGRFGLYRWELGAQASGPGPHFHRTMSESFYVLSGTLRLHDGRGWKDAEAGAFMYVPEGGIHGFRNESGVPASLLILFAPGAPREGYFEGLVELRARGASEEEMAEFYLQHDNYWVDA